MPPRVPTTISAKLIGRSDAPQGPQAEFLWAGDHAAAGRFDVFALQGFAHIEHGEIVGGELSARRAERESGAPCRR